ncbi:lysine--tRNA ligase [Patescibacteria group bacterium]|nr:lysine--tRNA ligase [Patescibacteria group bacterium]
MDIENEKNERNVRLNKIKELENKDIKPYAEKFDKKNNCLELKNFKIGKKAQTAGRVVLKRDMGKISFIQIQDYTGKIQAVFTINDLDEDKYKNFVDLVNIGDFIGLYGEMFVTKKGEISILVKDFTFLSKALRPLPDKFHGVSDSELKYRQRYLDLIMNPETKERFQFRNDFIWELRKFYKDYNFEEINTPILCNTASGALAKPFNTHHNALDIDVHLRIAPELYLKRAIIGGYERVVEFARCFRNEGTDPSHLQDFIMIEHYAAYWNFEDNMKFTEEMLTSVIKKLKGNLKIEIPNRDGKLVEVDFSAPWKKVSFRDLLIKDCSIDIDKFPDLESLKNEIKSKNIEIKDIDSLGRGNLIDALYKVVSRPKLINPIFLINHPIDVSPLARKNDNNPNIADRFQLVINGWEIVNAYSELTDPIDQADRFDKQMEAKGMGDEEAMNKDEDYIRAMEYGMPPVSGWGMGVERIIALLTKQQNLRDVVLFPLMRPEN